MSFPCLHLVHPRIYSSPSLAACTIPLLFYFLPADARVTVTIGSSAPHRVTICSPVAFFERDDDLSFTEYTTKRPRYLPRANAKDRASCRASCPFYLPNCAESRRITPNRAESQRKKRNGTNSRIIEERLNLNEAGYDWIRSDTNVFDLRIKVCRICESPVFVLMRAHR